MHKIGIVRAKFLYVEDRDRVRSFFLRMERKKGSNPYFEDRIGIGMDPFSKGSWQSLINHEAKSRPCQQFLIKQLH